VTIRVGVTLPSFVDDPEIAITVAQAAEAAGLDAVFVYDHLWRGDPPNRRPALECFALLGAVAAETRRVGVGTLVARATLRPPATLANAFETAHRIAGDGRLIAVIGAGDSQSRAENEAFGLGFGSMVDRVNALHDSVRAVAGGDFPVWIGGLATQVREIVAVADGWNAWGVEPDTFAQQAASVLEVAPKATLTWGGLARPREEGAAALADRLAAYVAAGATWVIVGPVDSSDPANAAVLGEVRERLNSPGYRAAPTNP
jgi:alkanesulfonate monooxygenase SsuD/methylene tetrahydromethanopterin reductase-like flavin-dependent oxidoreductase (luciferase family)